MKAVILGATSGMGRALARLIAARRDHLFLLGRPEEDLRRSAQELEVLGASGGVGYARCELLEPSGFNSALDAAEDALGGFDTFIFTAALFGDQETLENDTAQAADLLTANFTTTILLCEEVRRRLLAQGGGTLCVFSSVAGDRGRKPVILYGAAKGGLSIYLEGLDHKFRERGLKTITVKPGFVKTSMTEGLKPPPFAGEPEQVARIVLRAIDRGKPLVYAPGIWRWIMAVIRHLPRFVMRRIGF